MIRFIISLLICLLSVLTLICGLINYNSRNTKDDEKESFSFLNQFPYEMQGDESMRYNAIVKILSTLVALGVATFGVIVFWLNGVGGYKPISDYVISILFCFVAFAIVSEFNITLANYKFHLFSTATLFAGSTSLYIYVGLFSILDFRKMFYSALSYILLSIGAIMLLSLFVVPLKRWMYLEKEEKNGEITYHRKRLSILPFMEWLFIFFDVLLIVLITIFSK